MSHNTSYQQHLARVADLPPWTDDPLARLEHTLATRPRNPNERALTATAFHGPGVSPEHQSWTGLTWGDLQQLAAEVRSARAAARERATTWACRNCNAINEPDTETCDACGDIDRNRR